MILEKSSKEVEEYKNDLKIMNQYMKKKKINDETSIKVINVLENTFK